MENKEVVFVSNFFGDGGAARVISVLAEGLADQGYEVTICSYPRKDREEYYHSDKINYIKFKMRHQHGGLYKIERIAKLRREIKKHKDAVIISFEYFMNMQTVVAMAGLKNKLIISERNDPARVGGKMPTKQIRNFLYQFADCLVCQTQEALEYFPKSIQKKSVVILNSIKGSLPERWQGERRKEVVNFCRLEKQKNLSLLIDAFEDFYKKHTDYTLTIYGDGKERSSLEEYIKSKQLDSCVTLHHAVSDIHDRIKDAMMYVSSSNYEGLSNSMIEAMAIGLPTICTDCPCGGARMVIHDGENGILVPVDDKEAMVKAISKVADDQIIREFIAVNGYTIRKELANDRIVGIWEETIKKVDGGLFS